MPGRCSRVPPRQKSRSDPGTTLKFDGGSIPIKNGKVEGDKISFVVTFDFGGMTLDLSYTGVVTPSEIRMTGDFMGMPFEFTVKKA